MAGDVEISPPRSADADEHGVVFGEELGERDVATEPAAEAGIDAHLDYRVDLALDELTGEAVLRDAVDHHPAEMLLRLVNRHAMAGKSQVVSGREPTRTAPDHGHRPEVGRRHGAVRLMPERTAGEALHAVALADEALQGADCDWSIDRAPPAGRLARSRTHPPADRGKRIGPAGDQVRVAISTLSDRRDIGAGIGVDRAGRTARLVLPQPAGVGDVRHDPVIRQTRRRAWSRRRAHSRPSRATANHTVVTATRPLRSRLESLVSSRFGTTTSEPKAAATMATPDTTARGQLTG